MRAAERVRAALGEADVREEALGDERGERAHGVLDGHGAVEARGLEEVDRLGPAQRGERALDVEADAFFPVCARARGEGC